MNEKQLYQAVKLKLESEGTKFSEYYGGSLIYESGPKPAEFFQASNEGTYTVPFLVIPKKFYNRIINLEKVNGFLNKSR